MSEQDLKNLQCIYFETMPLFHIAFNIINRLFLNRKYTIKKIEKETILLGEQIINELQPELMIIAKKNFLPTLLEKQSQLLYSIKIYPFGEKGPCIDSKYLHNGIVKAIRDFIVKKRFTNHKRINNKFLLYYSNFLFDHDLECRFNRNKLKFIYYLLISYFIVLK